MSSALLSLMPLCAASSASAAVIDITHGPSSELMGKALALSRALFVPLTILSLALDSVFRGNPNDRQLGPAMFRAAVVLCLLSFYGTLFGGAVKLSQELETALVPADAQAKVGKALAEWQMGLQKERAEYEAGASRAKAEGGRALEAAYQNAADLVGWQSIGGVVFDSAVSLLLLLGQGAHVVMGYLSRILAGLLYGVGPLALVFAIPRASDSGGRWFRMLVTVLFWPVLSGIILSLAGSVLLSGVTSTVVGSQLDSVIVALLLLFSAVSCPVLASALVGGSMKNVSAAGFDAALFRFQMGLAAVKAPMPVVTGAAGRLARWGQPAKDSPGRDGGGGGSGGPGRSGPGTSPVPRGGGAKPSPRTDPQKTVVLKK